MPDGTWVHPGEWQGAETRFPPTATRRSARARLLRQHGQLGAWSAPALSTFSATTRFNGTRINPRLRPGTREPAKPARRPSRAHRPVLKRLLDDRGAVDPGRNLRCWSLDLELSLTARHPGVGAGLRLLVSQPAYPDRTAKKRPKHAFAPPTAEFSPCLNVAAAVGDADRDARARRLARERWCVELDAAIRPCRARNSSNPARLRTRLGGARYGAQLAIRPAGGLRPRDGGTPPGVRYKIGWTKMRARTSGGSRWPQVVHGRSTRSSRHVFPARKKWQPAAATSARFFTTVELADVGPRRPQLEGAWPQFFAISSAGGVDSSRSPGDRVLTRTLTPVSRSNSASRLSATPVARATAIAPDPVRAATTSDCRDHERHRICRAHGSKPNRAAAGTPGPPRNFGQLARR